MSKPNRTYKCPICHEKYKKPGFLYRHMTDNHDEDIPDGVTPKQYAFNVRNNKTKGSCVICKRETAWNEDVGRYERFCDNPNCRKVYVERFKKNMKRTYGKEHLLDDPEVQRKMLQQRSISGEYTFRRNRHVKIPYTGSYELDFLEYLDENTGINPKDVTHCPFIFKYIYEGKERTYIPDFFIHSLNIIIEIKDGGDNPNTHHKIQSVDKKKELLKDKSIIDSKKHHYIKIENKDYVMFDRMLNILTNNSSEINKNRDQKIIAIP